MKKRIKNLLILFIIILIGAGGFFSYRYYKAQKEKKQAELIQQRLLKNVKRFIVKKQEIPDYIEIDDEIEPLEVYNLAFNTSGILKKVYFKAGDFIKKGEIIAELDDDDVRLKLLQIEKDIEDAIINGSKQELEILKFQKTIYEKQLENCKLKAPFSGYIAQLELQENIYINSGKVVGQLYNLDYYISEVWINEIEIKYIKPGNKVEIVFTQDEKNKYYGEVNKIYKLYEKVDGVISYPVEIIFKSLPENILPGFTYTGKIYYGDRTDKLLVPLTSVNKDSKGYYVAKIENNSIVKKYIKIGDSNEKFYEVVNGLKEGDEILLINLLDYKNRQNFQLKNPMLRGIGTGTPGTRSNQPGK